MRPYPVKIDLHMHTTVSDGSDTPDEIIENVKEAGLDLFSVTDHDAVKACRAIRDCLTENDPAFICGVEFSCRDEEGKYHILGYGIDPEASPIQKVIETGHSYRIRKVKARLEYLKKEFGFTFPEEEIEHLISLDNPGKPHIALLMARFGYAPSKDEAIKNYINRVRFRSEYLRPEEAIEGILLSGGIPVLAHPVYGDGDQLILGEEMDERLRRLIGFGLQGVEAYYSGFSAKLTGQMLSFAEKYGLYITAGSDYHGKNKLVMLGDTGCENAAEGPEGMKRFLEAVLG